MAILIGLW